MSVVYGERGLSEMEFWKLICRIEKNMIFLLLHDFGVKNRSREPDFFCRILKFSDEDRVSFIELCEKYSISKVTDTYPEWLIEMYRDRILNTLASIKQNIRDANEVYPYYESEFFERRKYQDDAIRECGELYDIFTLCKETLPVDADKYERFVKYIEKEATLLKGWRKSDNRILRQIRKREAKEMNALLKFIKDLLRMEAAQDYLEKIEGIIAFLKAQLLAMAPTPPRGSDAGQ
jgi:hypothetical protein